MNKKIMYTFIPAIAAFGALVGFKSSSNRVTSSNDVVTNNSNKAMNVSNNYKQNISNSDIEINQSKIEASEDNLILSSGNTYYLSTDIDLSELDPVKFPTNRGFVCKDKIDNVNASKKVDFYLNGHSIKGYDSTAGNTNIFSIENGYILNLYDAYTPTSNNKHYFIERDANNPDNNCWLPSPENEVTPLSLDGGYLCCYNSIAVGIDNTSEFNMYGGSIVGYNNKSKTVPSYCTEQTIISAASTGAINIINGNIVGCNANSIIYGGSGSTIKISGGDIRNSYAKESIIYNSSTTEMSGGKIHNCYTGTVEANTENAIINNLKGSTLRITDTAEITDNTSLFYYYYVDYSSGRGQTGGAVVTYEEDTNIELGGTAKVIRNRASYNDKTKSSYAEIIKTSNLANIVIYFNDKSTPKKYPKLKPIIDGDYALKKGARFGVRAKRVVDGSEDTYFQLISESSLGKSSKEFFFPDNPNLYIKQADVGNQLALAFITDPVKPNEQITKKGDMPSNKPSLENAILLQGKLTKSIEVVIKDKESLGDIKETVEANIKKNLTANSNLICQFDISLEQDGVEIENIDGNVYQVTLKLPDNYAGLKKQKVIYIKDDGSIEMKETTVKGNKCSFVTDHFSTWGFAAEGKLGAALSGGAIAGIVLGTTAGGGGIFFVVFIIFFKKKLRFFVNGYKVHEERLKRNEDIDFTNSNVAGKQWYSDKECTKPFTKTKMGLFSKSVYTHSDDTYGGIKDNSNQVDTNKDNLITSFKNKVTSLFKKKNKETSEEQNNVTQEEQPNTVPEEQNNNNDIKQD